MVEHWRNCYLVKADDRYTLNQRIGALSVKKDDVVDTKLFVYILNRNREGFQVLLMELTRPI